MRAARRWLCENCKRVVWVVWVDHRWMCVECGHKHEEK